jgi:triosephosphate isomerase
MEKVFIVANLKSYETEIEAKKWLEDFLKNIKNLNEDLSQKVIIICPPFTLLELFKDFFLINEVKVFLGAQDLSPFDEGAYTGEVNAKQIKEFADYVLIGHSERRKNFNETDDMLSKKVEISLKYGLKPIFLVQGASNLIPQGIEIVAYEPIFAIGSNTPDTSENADKIAGLVKERNNYQVLYGGSVTSKNVAEFTKMENIKGVLVGGSSLDAKEFIKIIQNA